jgi:hypothetical protein
VSGEALRGRVTNQERKPICVNRTDKPAPEPINDGAAPGDRVDGNQLRNRVQYNEGKVKCGNSANKPAPDPAPEVNAGASTT